MPPEIEIQTNDILPLVRKVGNLMVPERLRLLFCSDIRRCEFLDVSVFFPYASPKNCVIDFRRVIPEINDAVQVFARMEIYLGLAPATVQRKIDAVNYIFKKALDFDVWDFRMMELSDLKKILNDGKHSKGWCFHSCLALKSFYSILASFFGQTCVLMDRKGLNDLISNYSSLLKHTKDAHKTPDIDPNYFATLEAELPMLVMDESLRINYRMCAALLWLEMYVGLRVSDLMTLKTNSHIVKKTTSGKEMDYLLYSVPKHSHGGRVKRYAECYMLPGAVSAFKALMTLRKEVPGWRETDSLFILAGDGNIDPKRFGYYVTKLFIKFFPDLCEGKWEEVKRRVFEGRSYRIPNITQYRVHLCSYLYRQGVRLHIIELGMSHLTDAMVAYYVRVQDRTFVESQRRSDNIIRTRINNDFDLDEHEEKGEELLRDFLLLLSRFRVTVRMLEKMKAKGYDYEVDRYSNKCRNIVSSDLRPGLTYLARVLDSDGREAVLSKYPSLAYVFENMELIISEISVWEKVQ